MSSESKPAELATEGAASKGQVSSNEPAFAIRVSDLSKHYHIYEQPHDRLRQSLLPRFQRLAGMQVRNYYREFTALRNVSFEVRKGETLGIIGRNGAGKSTLLQLICGTLTPSSGSVETQGRVAALLELGSGFNPEFTGRENVYMNGSVLGLTTAEIDARFDRIVEFAEIGDFIDQPVKTYSSGMYVRLAFAVIANVDADILIIDEALAVGDVVFTQKCMRFLRRFMEHGTLMFVSHDTKSVVNLCHSAIWLDRGEVRLHGPAEDVAEAYMQANFQSVYGNDVTLESLPTAKSTEAAEPMIPPDRTTSVQFFDAIANSAGWKSGVAEITSVRLFDASGEPVVVAKGGETVTLEIRARAGAAMDSPIIGFFLKDRLGQSLFGETTYVQAGLPPALQPGQQCTARFVFQLPYLPNGEYSMTVAIAEGTPSENIQHHWLHDAAIVSVSSAKLRYGLVGIPFSEVAFTVDGAA